MSLLLSNNYIILYFFSDNGQMMAFVCLTSLLSLLAFLVWYSKMWRYRVFEHENLSDETKDLWTMQKQSSFKLSIQGKSNLYLLLFHFHSEFINIFTFLYKAIIYIIYKYLSYFRYCSIEEKISFLYQGEEADSSDESEA